MTTEVARPAVRKKYTQKKKYDQTNHRSQLSELPGQGERLGDENRYRVTMATPRQHAASSGCSRYHPGVACFGCSGWCRRKLGLWARYLPRLPRKSTMRLCGWMFVWRGVCLATFFLFVDVEFWLIGFSFFCKYTSGYVNIYFNFELRWSFGGENWIFDQKFNTQITKNPEGLHDGTFWGQFHINN